MERFIDLAARRQSDRAFDHTRGVEPEKIARILEAAQLAPSACNAQPYKVIVVDDPELKNKVAFSFWESYDEEHTVVRFVTSWATTDAQLAELEALL